MPRRLRSHRRRGSSPIPAAISMVDHWPLELYRGRWGKIERINEHFTVVSIERDGVILATFEIPYAYTNNIGHMLDCMIYFKFPSAAEDKRKVELPTGRNIEP